MPAGLVGFLALKDGGYDIVLRQEVFLVVWWALALGVAVGVFPRAVPPPARRLAIAGLIALVASGVAALSWTTSDERAVEELARVLGYAGIVALAWATLDRRTWRAAAAGLFVAAAAICALALGSRLSPNLLPLDPSERALETQRLFQPFGYWNALAAWSAATVCMALAWSADGHRTAVRAAALACTPVASAALYLTYSRGGVIELALGATVVLALCRNRRRATVHLAALAIASSVVILAIRSQPEIADASGQDGALLIAFVTLLAIGACWVVGRATRRVGAGRSSDLEAQDRDRSRLRPAWVLGPTALGLVGLVVLALFAGRDGFGAGGDSAALARPEDPASRLTTAAGNRSAYWSEALQAFAEEPLHGIGPGTFRFHWARHGSDPELVVDAHSLPLETLAEQGLLGAVALAIAFVGLAVVGRRGFQMADGDSAGPAMAAVFVVYLVAACIDWMWELTAISALGLGAVAVLGAAASTRLRRRTGRGVPSGRRRALLALMLASIVAGAVQVPGIVATERVRDTDELVATGDFDAARDAADDAVTAAPWAAAPYAARAEVELELGRLSAAENDATTALANEPLEPAYRILAARVAFERGERDVAFRELRVARSLAPYSVHRYGRAVRDLLERLNR